MSKLLGEKIYKNRSTQGLTQDQFGAKYNVSGPAIFKFEKGYVKPSLNLWLRMAKDLGIPEKRAVLMWVKSKLPEEYRDVIHIPEETEIGEEEVTYRPAPGKIDYSRFSDPEKLRKAVLKDRKFPRELKRFLKQPRVWELHKPTGKEINILRDTFAPLGKGSVDAYRQALLLIRMFSRKA